jgi:outer membrane protein W
VIFFITGIKPLFSQDLNIRAGVYDFTDIVATEFYIVAPSVFIGYDCFTMSRLKFNVSAGFSYNSIKYNSNRHNLYMIPLFISMIYELPNPKSKIKPYVGGGLSFLSKADNNKSLEKTHYSITYGYHAIGGLYFGIKEKVTLNFDMRYNLLLNPAMEEIDISGIISTVGIIIHLGSNK